MNAEQTRALVIGGSIAGLLAARVLSDHFERVTIIERDILEDSADLRGGVPQARHLHALLRKGYEILIDLYPGLEKDMRAAGMREGIWGLHTELYTSGGWLPHYDSGLPGVSITRTTLEMLIRRHTLALPNVTVLGGCTVQGLIMDEDKQRVSGVILRERTTREHTHVHGHLVVDASGRNSKAPDWLTNLGYAAPEVTTIDSQSGYATRWYRRTLGQKIQPNGILIQPTVINGQYRGGGLAQVEDGYFVVTLVGSNGDMPPTNVDDFEAFALSLPCPTLHNAMCQGEAVSSVYGYRKLTTRMRHYEKLALPENFIITGDAACAFNPIYGQGMSVAAMQAIAMNDIIAKYDTHHLHGFSAQWQQRLYKVVQGAWMMALTEDMRYTNTTGGQRDLMTRLIHAYLPFYLAALPYDKVLSTRLFEAINLLRRPSSQFYPMMLVRVLWHNLFGRARKGHHPSLTNTPTAGTYTTAES